MYFLFDKYDILDNSEKPNVYLLDYDKDVALIPRQPLDGCPRGSLYRSDLGTCSCEYEHCSWDLCRLKDPPLDCLQRTMGSNGKQWEALSQWEWDYLKHAWVAQVIQGKHSYIKTNNCSPNNYI